MIGRSKAECRTLNIEMKLFLAIMAVSCHKSEYLLNILEEQFVQQGGNLEWLADGLQKVGNLTKFAEVNEVLAFRPWLMSPKHIEKLMEKDESGFSWNMEQVQLAIYILSTFHSLCCFVQGQGLTEDTASVLEQINMKQKKTEAVDQEPDIESDIDNHYMKYMQSLKELSEPLDNSEEEMDSSNIEADEDSHTDTQQEDQMQSER